MYFVANAAPSTVVVEDHKINLQMAKADPAIPANWPAEHVPVTTATALPLARWLSSSGVSQAKIADLFGVSQSSVSRFLSGKGGKIVEAHMIEFHGAKKPCDSGKPHKLNKKKKASLDDNDVPRSPPINSYRFLSYEKGVLSYADFWAPAQWRLVSRLDKADIPDENPAVYEFGVPGPDNKPVAKYVGKASACYTGKTTGYMRKRYSQYASKGHSNGNNPAVVAGFSDPDIRLFVRWRCILMSNDPNKAGARGAVTGIETELLSLYIGNPYEWNKRG
jgi:predicted XRE-type DNA-binding protein